MIKAMMLHLTDNLSNLLVLDNPPYVRLLYSNHAIWLS